MMKIGVCSDKRGGHIVFVELSEKERKGQRKWGQRGTHVISVLALVVVCILLLVLCMTTTCQMPRTSSSKSQRQKVD